MKRLLPLALIAVFPLAVLAADKAMKDDPHHNGMGGCASKEKVLRWKQLHGQGVFQQSPRLKDQFDAFHQEQQTEQPHTLNLDRFI